MEQGEDVIRYAAGICVVNEGVEAGWVAQKAVEHKWRFSCGRPDDAGMERSVLARQEGVDFQARVWPVFGVDKATATIGREKLAIR